MNWRQVLIAAWVVFSACWISTWSWYYNLISCGRVHEGEADNFGWHCDGPILAGGDYNILPFAVMVAVIIGIPLALGFGLIVFRLIVLDFYRSKRL
jgi:hypothetical protein